MAVTTMEEILLSDETFEVRGGDGEPFSGKIGDLIEAVRKNSVVGFDKTPLPKHNLAWKVEAGPLTICIVELEPALRRLEWIDPKSPLLYGPEAVYTPRRLATPYVILKVPFLGGRMVSKAELFYRNRPLASLDDELYWSNLLNVSPHSYGCRAWICTQYLRRENPLPGVTPGLHALMHHLWGGGFNRSSEQHEGSSAFKKAGEEKVDPRVTDVVRWEKESVKNPRFVLDVNWKPAGVTVGRLIQEELDRHKAVRNLGRTGELVNALSAMRKTKAPLRPKKPLKPK